MTTSQGFTLIEVLIALVIVALVLAASLRASGVLVAGEQQMEEGALAGWSAESILSEARLAHVIPPLGSTLEPCPQLDLHLVCEREVRATPNPAIFRFDVRVYSSERREHVLAKRVAFMSRLQ